MRKSDSIAFLENRKRYDISIIGKGDRSYSIALNFHTGLFYQMLSVISEIQSIEDSEKVNYISNIFIDVMRFSGYNINRKWVNENVSIESQLKLIELVINDVSELLKHECFVIPEIEVKKKQNNDSKNTAAKEREKTKTEIKRLSRILANKLDISLMNDIALLTAKTNNSYSDIMEMPIFIFKDLLKTVVLNELRADDDYNLAYLREKAKELQKELNNKTADKKPDAPDDGANLANVE